MLSEHDVVDILLVEDNLDDVEITKRAFKELNLANRIFVARDGQEALDFLSHKGEYENNRVPAPGLVLLDINLPKVNGIEVLKFIKNSDSLEAIPVVMLTVSKRDEDVVKSYRLGCNSFLKKPVAFEEFVDLVKNIGLYWGVLNVALPKEAAK